MTYEEKVRLFNEASGASYIAEVKFLTFRKTHKGVLVGYTCGKPEEVSQLGSDVRTALLKGYPFYRRGHNRELEIWCDEYQCKQYGFAPRKRISQDEYDAIMAQW